MISKFLLVSSWCLLAAHYVVWAADQPEPPFPELFDVARSTQLRAHIVSEIIGSADGYQTLDEYIDLQLGRQVLVHSTKDSHRVILVDGKKSLLYEYQPYKCATSPLTTTQLSGLESWSTLGYINSNGADKAQLTRFFGVLGLWVYGSGHMRTYSSTSIVYSAAKDIFKQSHNWTSHDYGNKLTFSYNFINSASGRVDNNPEMSLAMIQMRALDSAALLRTLNVLSVEYHIDQRIYDTLLQPPVGYGCVGDSTVDGGSSADNLRNWLKSAQQLELEVTATKFGDDPSKTRTSDTVSADLAVAKLVEGQFDVQMLRVRDSKRDVKTVLNTRFNTRYQIDLVKGSCQMSHLDSRRSSTQLELKFSNKMELIMDSDVMFELFSNLDGYSQLRRSKQRVHYEKSLVEFLGQKNVRIMKVFSLSTPESVTVWFLNEDQSEILSSYHMNIVDARQLELWPDLPRIFDVSDECYLYNDQMKAGKDYAWLELTYPLLARHVGLMASRSATFKRLLYGERLEDFTQTPKVELVFEDDGFILRMLQLDIPPVEFVYDSTGDTSLVLSGAAVKTELSPDLRHCSELCRFFRCQTMTYCPAQDLCHLSGSTGAASDRSAAGVALTRKVGCTTYIRPEDRPDLAGLFDRTLHRRIAELQSEDYSPVAVPKIPEELSMPMSESGLDEKTYKDIAAEYTKSLQSFLHERERRSSNFVGAIYTDGHPIVLIPSRFTVEEDPLAEFNLVDLDDVGAGDKLPPFHEGLAQSRFKVTAFDDQQTKRTRLFAGLSHDQCALACTDSRCSSFSYCNFRRECILTNIVDLHAASSAKLVEPDADCYVAQRDFLYNFDKFQGTYRPAVYRRSASSLSPAGCALSCVTDADFTCLSFDYCPAADDRTATCYYHDERRFVKASARANSTQGPTCSHYSRSYLADFARIESRKIADERLAEMRSTTLVGRNVFDCAEFCVQKLADCSAFQFCLDTDKQDAQQSCTLIQSPPADADKRDFELEMSGERVVRAGEVFIANSACHVFALRANTTEAHLRQLALGLTYEGDQQEPESGRQSSWGLSIGSSLLLFVCVFLAFTLVGVGVTIAKERSEFVRSRYDRIRILLNI